MKEKKSAIRKGWREAHDLEGQQLVHQRARAMITNTAKA